MWWWMACAGCIVSLHNVVQRTVCVVHRGDLRRDAEITLMSLKESNDKVWRRENQCNDAGAIRSDGERCYLVDLIYEHGCGSVDSSRRWDACQCPLDKKEIL